MKNKGPITEMMSVRIARARKRAEGSRVFRILGARGAATLALGAALSIGGLTDAISGVHFEVAKGLDSVQVVRHSNNGQAVVTNLGTGFTGNTVFKLSQIFPEQLVSRELSLFDEGWLPRTTAGVRPPS